MHVPTAIAMNDGTFLRPNITAATEPVHAPVTGSGIATKMVSPQSSYFSIFSEVRARVRAKSHCTNLSPNLNLHNTSVAGSKSHNTNGIGTRLPATAMGNASQSGSFQTSNARGIT